MQINEVQWSKIEEEIARSAFETAYKREMEALITAVQEQASSITSLENVWKLHDFLSARRHELDGKYDYRYTELMFVFARLLKEGWLHLDELDGLEPDKITKVSVLTRF